MGWLEHKKKEDTGFDSKKFRRKLFNAYLSLNLIFLLKFQVPLRVGRKEKFGDFKRKLEEALMEGTIHVNEIVLGLIFS